MQEKEDHLIQGTLADSTIRVIAAVTTNLVNEACGRHGTSPTASAALGRALTGALLLGKTYKDLEYITLRFDCRGELGGITAEASAHGTVRGYVNNPLADSAPTTAGKLDVGSIVGGGMLYVIREAGREIGLMKEPYQGSVPIVSGEIAEDIAHYLITSEQINSAISLGVFVEPEQGRVMAAGGYLIQVMPGADEETLIALEQAVMNAPHVTELIREGLNAQEMMLIMFGSLKLDVMETRSVEFRCKCSYDRAISIVSMLGAEEVAEMLENDKGADLTCHFCGTNYHLNEAALGNILNPPPELVM